MTTPDLVGLLTAAALNAWVWVVFADQVRRRRDAHQLAALAAAGQAVTPVETTAGVTAPRGFGDDTVARERPTPTTAQELT